MSYYWLNWLEILQKAKERYSKEKADEYYAQNKDTIKEKIKEYQKKGLKNLFGTKNKR